MDIYDIIHGSIKVDPLAKKIIDTEEFQRLRNIKQLGCCNFVFPGAVHTRFEHSIGVYHLAKKYIDILNHQSMDGLYFKIRDIECITIAALIHDIGHGPYSHLFDELFTENKDHEYRSGELFKRMNQKYTLGFNEKEVQDIIDYIYPKKINVEKGKKYLYQIDSNNNGIDVDRFDYLMRDIKMTGLNYGIEYERIMQNSKIIDGEIIYCEKVRTNIEEFYHVRTTMYKEVYNHRTVRSIEFMMKDFISEFNNLYNISEIIEKDNWDKFIGLNDSIIHQHTYKEELNSNENKMKNIINMITSRNLYRSIGELLIECSPSDCNSPEESKIKLEYDRENIIVDIVKISHSKNEQCNFYKEKNLIHRTIPDNNYSIIRVYVKDESYNNDALKLFSIISYQFASLPSSSISSS